MIARNVPLVEKVRREIVAGIQSANYIDDDGRLPSEEELARRFRVSRSTIRSALTSLEDSGIVTRLHGVGTYVNDLGIDPGSVWGWLDQASTFEDLIKQSNHAAKTVVLETDFREAGKSALPLRAEPTVPVLWIRKLFYSDATPVIFSETSIPLALTEPERWDLQAVQVYCSRPVYDILEQYFHCQVHHQTSEIRGGVADESTAQLLECKAGHPILCLEEVGYSSGQQPLYHAAHRFRGDMVSFRLVRRPVLRIVSDDNGGRQE